MAGHNNATKPNWVRKTCIGRGSFGVVSLAVDQVNNITFAVKSVKNKQSSEFVGCLENEIRILKTLSSPYVVRYLGDDVTCEFSSVYRNLHMEYMPNGTVADVAKYGDIMNLRSYTWCITSALSYVHSKIERPTSGCYTIEEKVDVFNLNDDQETHGPNPNEEMFGGDRLSRPPGKQRKSRKMSSDSAPSSKSSSRESLHMSVQQNFDTVSHEKRMYYQQKKVESQMRTLAIEMSEADRRIIEKQKTKIRREMEMNLKEDAEEEEESESSSD